MKYYGCKTKEIHNLGMLVRARKQDLEIQKNLYKNSGKRLKGYVGHYKELLEVARKGLRDEIIKVYYGKKYQSKVPGDEEKDTQES